jgi:hypothetical protein
MTRNVPCVTRLFCMKHPVQGRKCATTLGSFAHENQRESRTEKKFG